MIYNKIHLYFEVFGDWIHSAQSSEKSQPFLPVQGEDLAMIIDLEWRLQFFDVHNLYAFLNDCF